MTKVFGAVRRRRRTARSCGRSPSVRPPARAVPPWPARRSPRLLAGTARWVLASRPIREVTGRQQGAASGLRRQGLTRIAVFPVRAGAAGGDGSGAGGWGGSGLPLSDAAASPQGGSPDRRMPTGQPPPRSGEAWESRGRCSTSGTTLGLRGSGRAIDFPRSVSPRPAIPCRLVVRRVARLTAAGAGGVFALAPPSPLHPRSRPRPPCPVSGLAGTPRVRRNRLEARAARDICDLVDRVGHRITWSPSPIRPPPDDSPPPPQGLARAPDWEDSGPPT